MIVNSSRAYEGSSSILKGHWAALASQRLQSPLEGDYTIVMVACAQDIRGSPHRDLIYLIQIGRAHV